MELASPYDRATSKSSLAMRLGLSSEAQIRRMMGRYEGEMAMRILLVSPEYPDSRLRFTKKEVQAFWFPRLSCVTIAALTPPEDEVVFIDVAVDHQ
jgi:hypothetical protein